MSNTYKPIDKMKKDELKALLFEFDIPFPEEGETNALLKEALRDAGITDEFLKAIEEKQKKESAKPELNLENNDMCVVVMDRQNASYGYKSYRFFQEQRYQLMKVEDADELVSTVPGFRKASKEEVERHFKL